MARVVRVQRVKKAVRCSRRFRKPSDAAPRNLDEFILRLMRTLSAPSIQPIWSRWCRPNHCIIVVVVIFRPTGFLFLVFPYFSFLCRATEPAHVAEWWADSSAMCSKAWRAQWPRIAPQPRRIRLPKNYYF